MNLAQLLTADQIVPEMKSTEHRAAIKELVDHLEDIRLIPSERKEEVLELLYQREEKISTGIGSGVAIPHTFVDHLDQVVAVFGRSLKGIEFCALDNAPVYFVILFVVPQEQYHMHLRTLAAIAKMFNSAQIRQRLMEAHSSEEILEILAKRPART